MSVLSGLILEKIYELFVGTSEIVRYIRVSVQWSSIARAQAFLLSLFRVTRFTILAETCALTAAPQALATRVFARAMAEIRRSGNFPKQTTWIKRCSRSRHQASQRDVTAPTQVLWKKEREPSVSMKRLLLLRELPVTGAIMHTDG